MDLNIHNTRVSSTDFFPHVQLKSEFPTAVSLVEERRTEQPTNRLKYNYTKVLIDLSINILKLIWLSISRLMY